MNANKPAEWPATDAPHKVLKLVGVLLDYPPEALWESREELIAAAHDASVPSARREALAGFVRELLDMDPMLAQERWLGLFDRGRSMSLLLFEHIHGESRDRGQAMVDLIQTYRDNGFEMASKELPDYLPLMLEYLSLRPAVEVVDWLKHTGHILELLAARATERSSSYAILLSLLVQMGIGEVDLSVMRKRVATEERDDTVEEMDRVWEEEAVRFGTDSPKDDCAPTRRLPSGARRMESAPEGADAAVHRVPAAAPGQPGASKVMP
ncbi:MAG: nitrate reductase molybdenum cofactor assembly chaperone [Arenimonas sp.]